MITYDLIIPSASRPHLLHRTLRSLLLGVDQLPARVVVHNDERFPDRAEETRHIVEGLCSGSDVPTLYGNSPSPIGHGPSVAWLLAQTSQTYVLYSQDDHEVVRPLPVARALRVMETGDLNQIRFNKRPTMEWKGEYHKLEISVDHHTLCVADHWYFQTGLWRVSAIEPVLKWWVRESPDGFREHCEIKVNRVFNGQVREFPVTIGVPMIPEGLPWNDPLVRHKHVGTYIWGPIGEDRYIHHIGDAPEDWALNRNRG